MLLVMICEADDAPRADLKSFEAADLVVQKTDDGSDGYRVIKARWNDWGPGVYIHEHELKIPTRYLHPSER